MIKSISIISILLGLILCSSCASYYSVSPKGTPPKTNLGNQINIYIPEEDLNLKKSTSFGIVGLLFPIGINVGDVLKKYTLIYFNNMFNNVSLNKKISNGYTTEILVESYKISSIQKKATLVLSIIVNDSSNQKIFEKKYTGNGDGHAPIYLTKKSQKDHIYNTTQKAFSVVFDQVHDDLCNLFLYK